MEMLWRSLTAFLVVALLMPVCLPLAHRLGLNDHPGGRKQHEEPTSYIGGLLILVAIAASFLIFDRQIDRLLAVFLGGSFLLTLVGLVDDLIGLKSRTRFIAQIFVALLMIFVAGVQVHNLGDVVGVRYLGLGLLMVPFTIFIVVGVINALNMIDGSDGLAGGQAMVSLILFAAFAYYAGNSDMMARMLTAAAAVAGFLVWNLRFPWQPRARVFLGNAGSMFLGFIIAWAAVRLTQDTAHPVSPVLAAWAVAIPLIDCVALMFRRVRQGVSPFTADRNHLHHMLLDAGFSPNAVAWNLMGLSLALGMAAGLAVQQGIYRPLLVLVFLGLLGGYYRLTANRTRAVEFFRNLRSQNLGTSYGQPGRQALDDAVEP